mmetsp:Transcript_914/g.1986  ORF Transcript_914/g.1986 Transcript_914/m.1986 type:complete len:102 (+) Transcript_914:3974-4279(+)
MVKYLASSVDWNLRSTRVCRGSLIREGRKSSSYIFQRIKEEAIPLTEMSIVFHSEGASKVEEKESAKPNGSIEGMLPRAYSSAKQESGIRYALAVPRGKKC